MKQLIKKIRINTTLTLLTGLHIGGNSDSVEIGGIDNPVIKMATKNNQPYIPGSSLKGKIRCLLEQIAGSAKIGGNQEVNNLFGFAQNKQPSKLIVRDAVLTDESEKMLLNFEDLDMPYTESKYENTIDRVTAEANPRQSERVPAGAEFNVEFVINVWEDDDETALCDLLIKGMKALENDYLGGSGSRGYGQIKFGGLTKTELSESNNWKA